MPDITTPMIPALESITFDHLTDVSGGCHPKQVTQCAAPVQQMQVYAPQIYAPQIYAPQPQAYVPQDYAPRESVETSVYIGNAQQQRSYA